MKVHNKLVRSKIPEILTAQKVSYTFHIAGREEYKEKLYEKVQEESSELATDRSKEELADLLEVIEAIKVLNGWTTEEIEEIRLRRLKERGGFNHPIILDES